jgi:hydroxymethylbilane synthase
MQGPIRIATRGSKLALWQAEHIASRLREEHPGLEVELKVVKTSGDRIQDAPLARFGGKGLFVKEIEETLLRGEAELAVHSMKDIPSELPQGLTLGVVPERDDPADCFLSHAYPDIASLPRGSVVGTSSLRRQAQLLALRPDLSVEMLRGNLDTRLRKLEQGQYQAIIVAAVGLKRLGLDAPYTTRLLSSEFLPAVGQGSLGLEYVSGNSGVESVLACLDHPPSRSAVTAERSFLQRLEGGCQVPIGGHADWRDGELLLRGVVADLRGEEVLREERRLPAEEAGRLGRDVAEAILGRGGDRILREAMETEI